MDEVNKNIALITMERFDNRKLNTVGSSRIRMRWLLPYWPEAEEYVIGKKYDVLVFQKVYWDSFFRNKGNFEGITIFDLCDPDWLENKPVFEFLDQCDAVTTSTQALADFIIQMRPNALVKFIPDRVFLPESEPKKLVHFERLQTVGWFGYAGNSRYLTRTYDELLKRNINLVAIADAEIEPQFPYRGKLNITNVPYNYKTLNKELVKCDAVLLPQAFGDERAKYKSNNKITQAWALGMPVIMMPEDFDRLETKQARIDESAKNLQLIQDEYDVKLSVGDYRNLIDEIKQRRATK